MSSKSVLVLALVPLVAACAAPTTYTPPKRPVTTAPPPPQQGNIQPNTGFRPPRVMNLPGLQGVIGADAAALSRQFGSARLDVREDDARKMQFTGRACVLDIFLYPLAPGREATATHVEARRSDGRDVDRAACVAALRRQ